MGTTTIKTPCTEPGEWPEELTNSLSIEEVDALIVHAQKCSHHRAMLDADEEEFLADLRAGLGV